MSDTPDDAARTPVIEVENLVTHYGARKILKGIAFRSTPARSS